MPETRTAGDRSVKQTVPRINLEVIRRAYSKLANPNPYYIYEAGRDAIQGCAIRVLRKEVQIGTRADRGGTWVKVSVVPRDVTIEELEGLRAEVRRKIREVEDEEIEPGLREGRRMTWASAWELFNADYRQRRQGKRSPRTLEFYEDLFNCHVLPLYGSFTLTEFAQLRPAEIDQIPREVASRVRTLRPWADGSHTGNHVLRAMRMVWEWCRRNGWIVKDPFLKAEELETHSADVFLEDADLSALGEALRFLETQAREGSPSIPFPSRRSLLALRIVLYTGCRHVEELCRGKLSWLRTDHGIPRLEIPRAKGDRGGANGRFLYLGSHGLQCLLAIPRPPLCDDLVPGSLPGTQMNRLTEPWERLVLEARRILEAHQAQQQAPIPSAIMRARIVGYRGNDRVTLFPGDLRIPVKATRHTIKTIHPRTGIDPQHSRQLMGHEAASLGERVYLHQHGPSLSTAAAKVETFVRQLMGDFEEGVLEWYDREDG